MKRNVDRGRLRIVSDDERCAPPSTPISILTGKKQVAAERRVDDSLEFAATIGRPTPPGNRLIAKRFRRTNTDDDLPPAA